jgi:SnoaL-like domain
MLDRVIARHQIDDLLGRYCQAIDRCDIERLKSVYWPDAHDDHGVFTGNACDFAEWVIPALRQLGRTMHLIANCVIEFDDEDHAHGETYVVAYHEVPGELGATNAVAGGRYLDRFERRDGEWRISERVYVIDWNQNQRSTAEWNTWLYAQLQKRGGRYPDDPAYALFGTAGRAAQDQRKGKQGTKGSKAAKGLK